VEECGPCSVFASFTLAFALQLRKKHRKPSIRVIKTSIRERKTSVRLRKTSVRVQYIYYKNTPPPHPHPHTNKPKQNKTTTKQIKTQKKKNPHIHTHTHTQTHTLQNNIKPPQYKLKHSTRYTYMKVTI
jgi:hypothetical protein